MLINNDLFMKLYLFSLQIFFTSFDKRGKKNQLLLLGLLSFIDNFLNSYILALILFKRPFCVPLYSNFDVIFCTW